MLITSKSEETSHLEYETTDTDYEATDKPQSSSIENLFAICAKETSDAHDCKNCGENVER